MDFGSDSYIKNAQELFASWNFSNTSLACLNNFFIFIFFISVMVLT